MIKQMDNAGIDKAVLLILDSGIGMKEPAMSIEEIHELHAEVLRRHPDRFMVFAGIDPRREGGFRLFEKYISEFRFSGLKLYPPMGYPVDHPALMPYYELCEELGLAVLIHTGPSLPSLNNHLAKPGLMISLAERFSDVNFILAHAGYNLYDAHVQKALELPNVFADIAGFQSYISHGKEHMKKMLAPVFDARFNDKVLFGSDWPLFNIMSPLKRHINLIREIHAELFGAEESGKLANIMFNNAVKALRQ